MKEEEGEEEVEALEGKDFSEVMFAGTRVLREGKRDLVQQEPEQRAKEEEVEETEEEEEEREEKEEQLP